MKYYHYDPCSDGKKQSDITQKACSSIDQTQTVDQTNVSVQGAAVAIATGGNQATAIQVNSQSNFNSQYANSNAQNFYSPTSAEYPAWSGAGSNGQDVYQKAKSSINQTQDVTQANQSDQGLAFALATGDTVWAEADGVRQDTNGASDGALALQTNDQTNTNYQDAYSNAQNFFNTSTADGGAPAQSKSMHVTDHQKVDQVKPSSVQGKMATDWPETLNQLRNSKLNPDFNMSVAVNHNGKSFEVGADEAGNIKFNPNNASDVKGFKVSIDQNGKAYNIESSEDGSLFVNGKKVR